LTRVMKDEGLLNPSNLVSAGLYSPKGLTSFLREAQEPTFTRHKQLQVLVSVELVSRLAGIEAFLAA